MTGGTIAMIPHWMTFAWNDTFTPAACLMLASFALIRINDWYCKRKVRRAESEAGALEALFAHEEYRETSDYRPWAKR
jgi:hypothetical protein